MSDINDPVSLSGGPCAGMTVEGQGWSEGDEKVFFGKDGKKYTYRRINDDGEHLTADQAVYCGKATQGA